MREMIGTAGFASEGVTNDAEELSRRLLHALRVAWLAAEGGKSEGGDREAWESVADLLFETLEVMKQLAATVEWTDAA